MAFERFIVTHVDKANGHGYVRQLDADGVPPIHVPIRFDLAGMAEITAHSPAEGEPAEISYSLPNNATRQRQVVHGTIVVGSVAQEREDVLARDSDGYLFLRNWGFQDQLHTAQQAVARV